MTTGRLVLITRLKTKKASGEANFVDLGTR